MVRPLVMIVRETPSLADALQLLLETVGFRVRTAAGIPPAVAPSESPEAVRAIILACNKPRSEVLRGFPDRFPEGDRDLPLLVVGDRAAEARGAWPPNVHFVALPFDARSFVQLLDGLTTTEPAGTHEAIAIEP